MKTALYTLADIKGKNLKTEEAQAIIKAPHLPKVIARDTILPLGSTIPKAAIGFLFIFYLLFIFLNGIMRYGELEDKDIEEINLDEIEFNIKKLQEAYEEYPDEVK